MRSARVFAACVGLATTLTACDPATDFRYFREGIGPNLSREDLPEVTRLQEIYIAHICQQAGLARAGETCSDMGFGQPAWALFVQAGMNDIDLRCDSYLAWLDNKKRSTTPILKQLAALGGATAGILQAAEAGPKSIALAGIAFGLAAETFTNINSRLLQEVNHSTVQGVVLDNQQRFRGNIRSVPIDNRSAAIYLLRNYLRICLPFSIEMSINDTVTVYHRSGAGALVTREPMLTRIAVPTTLPAAAPAIPPREPSVITPRAPRVVVPSATPAPRETPSTRPKQVLVTPKSDDVPKPGRESIPGPQRESIPVPPSRDVVETYCASAPDEACRTLIRFLFPTRGLNKEREARLAELLEGLYPTNVIPPLVLDVVRIPEYAEKRKQLLDAAVRTNLIATTAPGPQPTRTPVETHCAAAPDEACRTLIAFLFPTRGLNKEREARLAELLKALYPAGVVPPLVLDVARLSEYVERRKQLLDAAVRTNLIATTAPGPQPTRTPVETHCAAAPDEACRTLIAFLFPTRGLNKEREARLAELLKGLYPVGVVPPLVLDVARLAEYLEKRKQLVAAAIRANVLAATPGPGQPSPRTLEDAHCASARDEECRILIRFLFPTGRLNKQREAQLARLLKDRQPSPEIPPLVLDVARLPEYYPQRKQLVDDARKANVISATQ